MPDSGIREKPKKLPRIIAWILMVIWAALIFLLSSIPGISYPTFVEPLNVVVHFVLYMVLGILLTRALGFSRMALWKVALIAIFVASLFSVSDVFHQFYVPDRTMDPMDWLVGTLGAITGAIVTIFYLSSKKVSRSRKKDAGVKK